MNPQTDYKIRLANPADFRVIQRVEMRASRRFSAIGLHSVAQSPPLPLYRLADFYRRGGLHVLTADTHVIGVAAHMCFEESGYLAELDVLAEYAGQRLGLRLLGAVEDSVRAAGIDKLWLLTYRDVPWNGPYYKKAGFIEQAPPPASELARRLRQEQVGPLGILPRIAMCKALC